MNKDIALSIYSQLKTLEMQVTGLRIQMERLLEEEYGPLPTFADLYGITDGQLNVSEEEIEAVLYREPPNMDEYYPLRSEQIK